MLENSKIRITWISFVLVTFAIFVFLYRWQVIDYKYYTALAASRTKVESDKGLRGKILSSDGAVLAYSVPAYDVFVYRVELKGAIKQGKETNEEFATKVSEVLGLDRIKLLSDIDTSPSDYFKIASKIDLDTKNRLLLLKRDNSKNRSLEGFIVETTEKRVYPDNTFASHVLGYVGKDTDGNDRPYNGVEGYWAGEMTPQSGSATIEKDGKGNIILGGEFDTFEKKNGRDVRLTINRGIQSVLEKKLKEGSIAYEAEYTSGIVMDPKTGKILAMAMYPDFDPNTYFKSEIGILNNRLVSDPYEAGSIMKAVTTASAIDAGTVTPETVLFKSHNGCIEIEDERDNGKKWKICTAKSVPSRGPKNVIQMLQTSDNIGAYYVAKSMGLETMESYFRKFGIGKTTEAGLSEESTSSLKKLSQWNDIDMATYAYGQGFTVTPIQAISAFATIANKGMRMKPQIVEEVIDNGKVIPVTQKLEETVIKEDSALITSEMLKSAFTYNVKVNGNTKKYSSLLSEYSLAGKSGTAQIARSDGPGYYTDQVNTTYVGFDASPDSKFVMLIKLHKPKDADFSASNVFPLWVETFIELKDLLGVEKNK